MAYRKKIPKRKYAKKRTAKRGKRPALKKMIRKELSSRVEIKTIQSYVHDRTLVAVGNTDFLTSTGSIGNMIVLGPDPNNGLNIIQGTGQGQRIGNKISVKSLIIKGTICPKPYDITYNVSTFPLQVKMWIFYDKTAPNNIPNPTADFFQNGNSSKGWFGDLVDTWSPVNTDRYRVLATRTFKVGYASNEGTGAIQAYQGMTNNDYKMSANFSINLTKIFAKSVKYNDTSSYPTSRGLYCLFTYAAGTGGTLNSLVRAAEVQWMQSMKYTDM
jgi:hypothetical protein